MGTRTFLAVDVDDVLLDGAMAIAGEIHQRSRFRAKWVAREVMHVTVRFFGDVDDDRLAKLIGNLPALGRHSPPALRATRVDAFPDARRARVLVLPLEDEGFLSAVHARVESVAAALGFERETRTYRPHLTLARLREPVDVRKLAADARPAIEGRALALTLYQSTLGPNGPKYSPLARRSFEDE